MDERAGGDCEIIWFRFEQISRSSPQTLVNSRYGNGQSDRVARIMVSVDGKTTLFKAGLLLQQAFLPCWGEAYFDWAARPVIARAGVDKLLRRSLWDIHVEAFESLESRLHLRPGKRLILDQGRPLVIVVPCAYRPDAKVDCAGAADPAAALVRQLTPVAVFLRGCLVAHVHVWVGEGREPLACYPVLAGRVVLADLQKKYRGRFGRPGKQGCQGTTGRAT